MNSNIPEKLISDDEKSQIECNLSNPRMEWILPPILPGDWQNHTVKEASELLAFLGHVVKLGIGNVPLPIALNLDRVRTRQLVCYKNAILVEAQGYDPEPGILGFIIHGLGITVLNGSSPPIHELNSELGLKIDSIEAVSDYVLLFLNWVHSDEGRFQPLIKGSIFEHRLIKPEDKSIVARHVKEGLGIVHDDSFGAEFVPHLDGQMRYGADINILYGNKIFEAKIIMGKEGMLEMVSDNLIAENLETRTEKLHKAINARSILAAKGI
ncbi:MAG: hypothetical protein J0L55_14180 [Caulobacterales bacterium]|nr:hypothetical protein [Caulobacterales bacterium]